MNAIGPILANLDPSVQENKFYFLPDRDDPANSGGFLVAEASYGLRVWYLADYSTGLEASWSIDLNNSSRTRPTTSCSSRWIRAPWTRTTSCC